MGADDAFYCNLEENMKPEYGMESTPVLVCKDPVYDITHYVNYGRDEYIYAYWEEVAELAYATKLSTSDMLLFNGVVYLGNKLRIALDGGTQCYMQNADGTSAQLEYFYTDGENVFCVSGGKLWRFQEWKNDSVAEEESVAGMPLAIGAYIYRLYEP